MKGRPCKITKATLKVCSKMNKGRCTILSAAAGLTAPCQTKKCYLASEENKIFTFWLPFQLWSLFLAVLDIDQL